MTRSKLVPTSVQHLYRREPMGVYYALFYGGGRAKWISLRTKIFEVAKAKFADRLKAHYAINDALLATSNGKATVGDLAQLYLQDVHLSLAIKETTKEYRRKTIKYLFRSWSGLETKAPANVTESDCKKWAAEYCRKFSPTLYNNTRDSLRKIFELAILHGLVTRNPANAIARVRVPPNQLQLPTQSEFHQLVKAIRGNRNPPGYGDLIEFLAYSGLRATEASLVRWQDIDLEKGLLYVVPGKNGEARRVPIADAMRDLLTRMKVDPRYFRDNKRRIAGYVLSVTSCGDVLARACRELGLAHLTRHSFRHLFATRAIESGIDVPTVSKWLGHKDGGVMCMKVYGHLRSDHFQAMVKKLKF